jgi:hypothetical protein
MRIYEILREEHNKDRGNPGKVDSNFDAVSTGMTSFNRLRNTDPYMQYRLGLAIANANSDAHFDQETPYAENFSVVAYTDAEQDIIDQAGRAMGVNGKTVTKRKSVEPKGTNTASTVAKPKRNRYGV